MTTAPKAPGRLRGNRQRAVKVDNTMINDTQPAIGCEAMSKSGSNLISTKAIAVNDPSKPARGTFFRTHPLKGAQPSLKIPDANSIVMPKNQACRADDSGSSPRASAAWYEG